MIGKPHPFIALMLGLLASGIQADPAPAPSPPLQVAVPADVYHDYQCWLRHRQVLRITDYRGDCSRRDVIEVALLQQALALGRGAVGGTAGQRGEVRGNSHELEWVIVNSYERTLTEMDQGRLDLAATSLWREDIALRDNLWASTALLGPGSNLAQLYGRAETAKNTTLTETGQLADFRLVSSRQWRADWQLLTNLPHGELLDAPRWMTMVRWVESGRADLLLAPPLTAGTPVLRVKGSTLHPVPGGILCLPGSRHFAVSRQHPEADAIQQALNKGINTLRQQGRLRRAYEQAGALQAPTHTLNHCQ